MSRQRGPVAAYLILLVLLTGCTRQQSAPVWQQETGYRWAELDVSQRGAAGFETVPSAESGIDFVNVLGDEAFIRNSHTVNGSGVAVGDVDGDGYPDVYFARLEGPNALYRNLGGWRFEEITEAAGVAAADRFSTGAVLADVDGDEDLDLLLTALGGPNALYENDGSGHFTEVTSQSGLTSSRGSTTMALADVDGDGDLDLYVANYKVQTVRDVFSPDERAMGRTFVEEDGAYRLLPEFEPHYRLSVEGNQLMRFEIAEADAFYLNDGTGRFTPVSFTDGAFLDEDGRALSETPREWGLTVRFQDVNGDGLPDLYVCNDFESPDHIWLNAGGGVFRAISRLSIRKTSNSTMAMDVSDVDWDGDLDLFAVDMLSLEYRRYQVHRGAHTPMPTDPRKVDARPQVMQNTLLLNRGDGTYAETAYAAGVAASEWSWSSVFLDVDLDGYEDLLITNGHRYDAMDADTQMRIAAAPVGPEWRRSLLLYPNLDLPNVALRNEGGGRFAFVPEGWGFGPEADVSHGLALADFDLDGDLDAVVNRLNRPAGLYRNTATAPRLVVRLRGLAPNTQGIGARVRLSGADLPPQQKEVVSGGQYLSGSEALVSLAAVEGADRLEVQWRSGRRSVIEGVSANLIYEVYEEAAQPVVVEAQPVSMPLFETMPLDHRHVDAPYDDFRRWPLLSHRLSGRGPGVALADLDEDGDTDMVVGSGRGGRLSVFRNEEGRWMPWRGAWPEAETGDQTGVLVIPAPGSGVEVLVGMSNIEGREEAYVGVYRVSGDVVRELQRLEMGEVSPGGLAAGDVDGDGQLDLFVGGWLDGTRYPTSVSSRWYLRAGDRWVYDADRSAAFEQVGMVTGVSLGDVDGDGDLDVVLGTMWSALRYYENVEGQFKDQTERMGLDAYRGWWQGVALGDFDGDGRLDVVGSNWGTNSRYGAGEGVRLYYGDWEGDGRVELVEAMYEASLQGYVPVAGLKQLMAAVPLLARRVRSFKDFAGATLPDLVGPSLNRMPYHEVNTLAHTVFLNRGDHFEAHPLPRTAQLAPAFAAAVGDYNGDGHEDVFLSQNFFGVQPDEGRLDAGRGLWLRGDGQGGFTAEEGTGVAAYGEGRGAALGDVDGDGRLDVVVTQHGWETQAYRGVGGEPGIRVRLEGPAGNRWGVGAELWLVYEGGRRGAVRVVGAGTGYWSQSSVVQVLGGVAGAVGVGVRWGDGLEVQVPLEPGARSVVVRYNER